MRIGLGLGLTRLGGGFNPASLFGVSDIGWVEPMTIGTNGTLFQDSAGTTPVTAPGQPVGLSLDASKGLVLGPELVTNGDFSNGTTGWTVSAQSSISGGQARVVSTDGSFQNVAQNKTLNGPAWYEVSLDVVSVASGSLSFAFTGAGVNVSIPAGAGRRVVRFFVASNTSSSLSFGRSVGVTDITLDNISVRELPGNHFVQPTALNRPIYGIHPITGRRNLLTYTEDFSFWTDAGSNASVSADGFGPNSIASAIQVTDSNAAAVQYRIRNVSVANDSSTYTGVVYVKKTLSATYPQLSLVLSGGTGVDRRVTINTLSGAIAETGSGATAESVGDFWKVTKSIQNNGTGNTVLQFCLFPAANTTLSTAQNTAATGSATFCAPQLEIGSTATPYQKVVSQYEVTEAGVQSIGYLSHNGSNQWMSTSAFAWVSDKATIVAGVRKLSDAARGVIVELGANADTTDGGFLLTGPNGASLANFAAHSRGTALSVVGLGTANASPVTRVISMIAEISTDTLVARQNGAQVASVTTDQGTGNFGTYPLYRGARAGSTLFFNGNIYPNMGINRLLTAAELAQVEAWVNQRTGAY